MANEKRLIDVNELVDELEGLKSDIYGWEDYNTGIDSAVYLAENAPTVDAVEVTRCKDCKHSVWDEENEMWKCVESADYDEDVGEWFGFYEYHNGDFFCADGGRKDNG